jgi:nonstructural protein NSm
VCGQLLIISILVLLFDFEVPLKQKKNYQKKKVAAKKKKIEKEKETKKKEATTKKGLCVCFLFFCAVVLCDYLCVQARVSSTV